MRTTRQRETRHQTNGAKHVVHDTSSSELTEPAETPLPAKVRHLIESLTKPFYNYVEGFRLAEDARADIAPKFMKVYDLFHTETGGSFISFVRQLDPTVPPDRAGYKKSSVYSAADYLRRLVAQAGHGKKPTRRGPKPESPMHVLAVLVATVLPRVDTSGAIWRALVQQMHWDQSQADRLQRMAQKVGPLTLRGRAASGLKLAPAAQTAAA